MHNIKYNNFFCLNIFYDFNNILFLFNLIKLFNYIHSFKVINYDRDWDQSPIPLELKFLKYYWLTILYN